MRGDRKFNYDARGNLIQENRGKAGKLQTRYYYNHDNQLIKVDKNGQTTTYKYDPLGRRIEKTDAFGSTKYLWAGDPLTQETRNNLKKTYIYEPESFRPVAMVQQYQDAPEGQGSHQDTQKNCNPQAEVFNYHLDHLGTPKHMSNGAGEIVWQAHYSAYGNAAIKIDTLENPIRFQGQYFDEETGLHYNRHRYYDPSLGQFTQQDPIGLLGGVNNYQYAPNPISWVDPLGLKCKEPKPYDEDVVDPVLQKHLDSLPADSYELIEVVDRPGQGFTNDRAAKIKLLKPIEGHRFSGGGSNPAGPYIALGDMPASRYDARQKLALKNFGNGAYNNMTHHTQVTMDKGAVVFIGDVAPQTSKAGKHYSGGGTQVFAEFWQPENKDKVHFSEPKKMPRHKIVTTGKKS